MKNSFIKFSKSEFVHETPSRHLVIEKRVCEINRKHVRIDVERFSSLCRENCCNYGVKYSCPPYSPPFNCFENKKKNISVICFSLTLDQYAPLPFYQRIRAGNAVLKSIIDRELISLRKKGVKVAGSGSCRACKPCEAKLKNPCKKTERKIFSLEAMGVDVGKLVQNCFGFELQWYIKGEKPPEYTCVVGASIL